MISLPGIRHLVIGEYVAFYRVGEDSVEILRVLHGRRNHRSRRSGCVIGSLTAVARPAPPPSPSQSSSTGSQPTDSLTKPGAHRVAPAGAALGRSVHAAERGGRLDQRAAVDEASALSSEPSVSPIRKPKRSICMRARLCDGSSSRPGKRMDVTAGCPSAVARSSRPNCTCGRSGPPASPARDGPARPRTGRGWRPTAFANRVTAAMISAIAAGDMAEQHVGMAVRRLGVGGDDDVGAEVERTLAVGRHGRVVGDDDRAGRVGGGCDGRDVANVEPGIGWASRRRPDGSRQSRRRESTRSAACRWRRPSASGSARPARASCSSRRTAGGCGRRPCSRPKNTAEIAAMPDGKATHGASSRWPSSSSTASQVGLSKRPYWLKPAGSPGRWYIAAMVERQRHRIALGELPRRRWARRAARDCGCFGHGVLIRLVRRRMPG